MTISEPSSSNEGPTTSVNVTPCSRKAHIEGPEEIKIHRRAAVRIGHKDDTTAASRLEAAKAPEAGVDPRMSEYLNRAARPRSPRPARVIRAAILKSSDA